MKKYTIGHAVQVSNKESNNDGNIGVIINTYNDIAEVDFSLMQDSEELPISCLTDITYHSYNS